MRRGRKDNNKAREQAKKRRAAIIRNGEKKIVVEQGNTKGYNLLEIRDFLDQLLLELRAQHYENQNILKALKATDDLQSAIKSGQEVSEKLVNQLANYYERYQTSLIVSHGFDHRNATDAESKVVMTEILKAKLEKRDTQLGHLEALQDLFEEVFSCAQLPCGVDKDGNVIQAGAICSVREIMDQSFLAQLPIYENCCRNFATTPSQPRKASNRSKSLAGR